MPAVGVFVPVRIDKEGKPITNVSVYVSVLTLVNIITYIFTTLLGFVHLSTHETTVQIFLYESKRRIERFFIPLLPQP